MSPRKKKAGRPILGERRTIRKQITMEPSYWADAKKLGRGNTSAGIRLALDLAKAS